MEGNGREERGERNKPISIPPSLELLLRQLQERFPDKPSPDVEHRCRYLPALVLSSK